MQKEEGERKKERLCYLLSGFAFSFCIHESTLRNLSLFVGHATFARALYVLDVFVKCAAAGFERWGFPFFESAFDFGIGEIDRDQIALGIDRDRVAISHDSDRATELSLGCDVTDDEAMRTAGEATIGNECDIGTETCAS